jgi:predicted enzyme related to lactoylglutathione lyase
MAHGQIAHIEFPSDDLGRARTFYEGVFGWQLSAPPGFPDYETFESSGGPGGGIGLRGKTAPQAVRVYVSVDSIDDALVRVQELGGSIVVEKTEVPGMGSYAAVIDTEGSEIGLWEDSTA